MNNVSRVNRPFWSVGSIPLKMGFAIVAAPFFQAFVASPLAHWLATMALSDSSQHQAVIEEVSNAVEGMILALAAWLVWAVYSRWLLSLYPARFFYFSNVTPEPIVGYFDVLVDRQSGCLQAHGTSYALTPTPDPAQSVSWQSELISGSELRLKHTCAIVYTVNEFHRRSGQYQRGVYLLNSSAAESAKYEGVWMSVDKDHLALGGRLDVERQSSSTVWNHVRNFIFGTLKPFDMRQLTLFAARVVPGTGAGVADGK